MLTWFVVKATNGFSDKDHRRLLMAFFVFVSCSEGELMCAFTITTRNASKEMRVLLGCVVLFVVREGTQ